VANWFHAIRESRIRSIAAQESVNKPGCVGGRIYNTKRTANIIKEVWPDRRYGAVNILLININVIIARLIRSM
jgi:hypothetical protein